MKIRSVFVLLAFVLPNSGAAQGLPAAVATMIEQSELGAAGKAAVAAKWPAADLEDAIAGWARDRRDAISGDAVAAIVADALIEEQRWSAQLSAKPEEARQSVKRALVRYLHEEVREARPISLGTDVEREFGQYSDGVKKDNYVGTIEFETQTSGNVTNSGRLIVGFTDVNSVILTTGGYELTMEKGGNPCKVAIAVNAGRARAPSCP
jgi:hypothetical protein